MSGQHFSRSSEVAHLVAAVKKLPAEEVLETYGIEIDERGVVWDTLYEEEFMNVRAWAVFTVEQEAADDEYEEDESRWTDDEH
jgi:hypothetical protein